MSEMSKACALVRVLLDRGFSVTVDNGEEIVARRSRDEREICEALGQADMETLVLYRDGARQGAMLLVWGNDPDGSELVCDYTDTPQLDAIWREVFWDDGN